MLITVLKFIKKTGILLFFLVGSLFLFAQDNQLQKINTYLKNSDHFFEKEDFDNAIKQANNAFELSQKKRG